MAETLSKNHQCQSGDDNRNRNQTVIRKSITNFKSKPTGILYIPTPNDDDDDNNNNNNNKVLLNVVHLNF